MPALKSVRLDAKTQHHAPHVQTKTASLAPHSSHQAALSANLITKSETGSADYAKKVSTSTLHPKPA